MFGNLFDRILAGNIAEDINRQQVEQQVDYSQSMLATSERARRRTERHFDELLDEEITEKMQIQDELDNTKIDLQRKTNENMYLKLENERLLLEKEKLKETAINIAVDRRAIFNTIEYLNNKWGVQSPRSSSSNTLLFDEAEEKRQEELKRMMANEEYLESVAGEVETFSKHNIKTNNMLLKKKAK